MGEGRDTDAAPLAVRFGPGIAPPAGPAGGVARLCQAFRKAAGCNRLAADPAPAGFDRVLQPEFDGIEAQPVGKFVDLRFCGEGHLGIAVAAKAGGAQPVCVDGPPAQPAVRDIVRSARHQQAESEHRRAVLGIGAAVVDDLQVARDQRAVGLRAGPDADDRRMAPAHRHEILFAGERQPDRPAGRPGEVRDERLDRDAGLAAESAADRRRGDPDIRHGQVQGAGEGGLHLVDRLAGAPDGQLAGAVELGDGGDRLQIDMGLRRNFVDAFEDDVAIRPGRLDIAFAQFLTGDFVDALGPQVRALLVAVEIRMHRNRPIFQGLFDAQHRRQFLVINLDQRRRGAGGGKIGGGNRGDRLADIAHDAGGERGFVIDEQAPAAGRQVCAREHCLDSGQRPGRGGVDAEDARARIGAAENSGVQHTRPGKVVRIARRTGQLVSGVASRQPFADRVGDGGHGVCAPAPASAPTERCPARTAASTMLT